ncbi:MAG: Gmad2 immunoglobulin-like domain-containing protein [bacterium]
MDNQPININKSNVQQGSQTLWIIISVVIITAIVVGGGMYYYQKSVFEKERQELQEQIDKLSQTKKGELADVYVVSPKMNQVIQSPLAIEGKAKGTWFFEGDFLVVLVDWDGKIIGEGYVIAQSDWMTEGYVLFKGTLNFNKPSYGDNGTLIFRKDNPSGLPQYDDAFETPIRFN